MSNPNPQNSHTDPDIPESSAHEDRHSSNSGSNAGIAKLENEIRILTERNNDILESITEAFFTLDKNWQFTYANKATGALLSREPETLIGTNIWAEYPGLIGSDFEPIYLRAMVDRIESRITEYYPDHNRWYEVNVFPASSGGVTIYFKDVSENKKAQMEIEKLNERNREILESITDGFFAVDENWILTYVNKQATQILEMPPGELLGKPLFEIYPGIAGTGFERAYRAAHEGTTSTFTAYYPDHDRWYEVNAYPAPSGITVYFRNATERMRTEEALRESDRKKDEFIATLAHELRNPLAPIRSGIEALRRARPGETDFDKILEIVERQTNQIVHLVDDLLDISRISQGKIHLKKERISLEVAFEMAFETSRDRIAEAENTLTVTFPDRPVYLDADLTRIAQIFLNILNNAAKYSDPGGKITVAVTIGDNEVRIGIRDTGLGIAPGMLSQIFEIFGQVETPDQPARGGLGIGLSVVKRLVEMHDGRVEVFSDGLGKGSEFVVHLPLAGEQIPAAGESGETMEIQTAPAQRYKILVVDDNEDAVIMLKALLSIEGHDLRTAFDAYEGIDIAREFRPGICLCDIGLPGMNGYELAVHLRTLLPQSVLISISGWGQDEDRRRSREAGFDHHMVKPVEVDDLIDLIEKLPRQS